MYREIYVSPKTALERLKRIQFEISQLLSESSMIQSGFKDGDIGEINHKIWQLEVIQLNINKQIKKAYVPIITNDFLDSMFNE